MSLQEQNLWEYFHISLSIIVEVVGDWRSILRSDWSNNLRWLSEWSSECFPGRTLVVLIPPKLREAGELRGEVPQPREKVGFPWLIWRQLAKFGTFLAEIIECPAQLPLAQTCKRCLMMLLLDIIYCSEKEPSCACSLWNGPTKAFKLQKSFKTNYYKLALNKNKNPWWVNWTSKTSPTCLPGAWG